jgi:hypothetical protein
MGDAPDCSRAGGRLRRAIGIAAEAGEIRAAVEDDFHHFRVRITHRDGIVTDLLSETPRTPWTACAHAGDDWSGLIGLPLEKSPAAVGRRVEMRLYCTHMFELAGLAMAAAARGVTRRRLEAVVPYGARRSEPAVVSRDGEAVFAWLTDGATIAAPEPFAGRTIGAGFSAWVEGAFDLDEAEAALVLRRAVFISAGRTMNLDAVPHAMISNACYAQHPDRAPTAHRMIGSTQDFDDRPQALLADDLEWLEAVGG